MKPFISGPQRVQLSATLQTNKWLSLCLCLLVCLYYMRSTGSDQSQREEDFYYTKISCEAVDAGSAPAPSQQALGQAPSSHLSWASSGSPPGSGLQIPPAHRPRSNSSSGLGMSRPSLLSQSAPCSFWQIHSEHLYQVGAPLIKTASMAVCCNEFLYGIRYSKHSNPTYVGQNILLKEYMLKHSP